MTHSLLPRTDDLSFDRIGFRFTRLTESRWRIANARGSIVGYLEHTMSANPSDGWSISRMTADRQHLISLGSFASADEAIDALKWM